MRRRIQTSSSVGLSTGSVICWISGVSRMAGAAWRSQLLALSGHPFRRRGCLLLGMKRTSLIRASVSANGMKLTCQTSGPASASDPEQPSGGAGPASFRRVGPGHDLLNVASQDRLQARALHHIMGTYFLAGGDACGTRKIVFEGDFEICKPKTPLNFLVMQSSCGPFLQEQLFTHPVTPSMT